MDRTSPASSRTRRRPRAGLPRGTAAVGGALLAGAALLGTGVARHGFDPILLAVAVAAVVAAGVALGRDRHRGPSVAQEAASETSRAGAAEALLANIPDPVIMVDRRGLVIEANAAARAVLPSLKAGQPLSFALRDPGVLDGIDQVLKTGEMQRVAYGPRSPADRTFEVQIGPMSVRDASEAPPDVVLFFRDLTEARRLEHVRVDFIANVSHELRTPLASVLGFIETLQGPARNDPAARARFLEIMRDQAQRMTRLIDDLLSLSRIELRAHVQPSQAVDLRPVVSQVLDSLGPLARDRDVELVLTADEEPFTVRGDRDELVRVVENLIENAVKYGESGGRVDITLARRPGRDSRPGATELSVRDYGPGIAPEHLPRLTERFYRVDVAESRQKGGTGLGLAIVKHIVNRHRGRLTVESEPGQGALFRVVLPE